MRVIGCASGRVRVYICVGIGALLTNAEVLQYYDYFGFVFLVEGVFAAFFFQAEDGIRGIGVTGVQTCALPISGNRSVPAPRRAEVREESSTRGSLPGRRH